MTRTIDATGATGIAIMTTMTDAAPEPRGLSQGHARRVLPRFHRRGFFLPDGKLTRDPLRCQEALRSLRQIGPSR